MMDKTMPLRTRLTSNDWKGAPAGFGLLCSFLFALAAFPLRADTAPKPISLLVQPSSLELKGADVRHGLLVTAVYPDNRKADVTASSHFSVGDTNILRFANGLCEAVKAGAGEVVVEFGGLTSRVAVAAAPFAKDPGPSFRQDIVPALTRFGCNSGGCHGKLAGQNSFKLSLRGYAPEWDHEWITREIKSRRVDFAFPESSALVQKPAGIVPHQGGQRFEENSRVYQMLVDWIKARAPGPDAKESDCSSLEILPGDKTLKPGETQQLLVRAHYPDGRTRDATWLSQFYSNDETIVKVSPEGLVKGLRPGETSVRVHFQGQVAVILFTLPFETEVSPGLFAKQNNFVDKPVFAKLQSLRIPPSDLADDASFLRRASLDVTGTLPSAAEVRAFLADPAADKRAKLIDRLLDSPEYVDFWTLQLSDLLQNRKERDHDVRGAKGVRAFQAWIRAQVAANKPWSEIARAILTASGDSVSKPEIAYYIVTVGEKDKAEESEITDSVAQSFLGTRIGCARCHNHPLEKYTQDDFYHFSAFFSRLSLKREEPAKGVTLLYSDSKEEEQKKTELAELEKTIESDTAELGNCVEPQDGERQKKLGEKKEKLVSLRKQFDELRKGKKVGVTQPRTQKFIQPQPLDRAATDCSPLSDPREKLADWIVNPKNEQFSGSMVNRLWKHYLGVGLVEPVDDLRASNPPSNPELWKALSQEFVSHGYDLKHLMRVILNSRTYQLSSFTEMGNETERRFYSHYYARRLPSEALLDAISQATDVPEPFTGYPTGLRAIQLPEPGVSSYFLSLFGRSDRVTACACERNGDVSLPQLLHINNGEDILKKIKSPEGRLARILKENPDDRQATEEIFLAALGRKPSAPELEAIQKSRRPGDQREEVYQDLFWALLNTKEFAFNH